VPAPVYLPLLLAGSVAIFLPIYILETTQLIEHFILIVS
jgi:hypothetical protein